MSEQPFRLPGGERKSGQLLFSPLTTVELTRPALRPQDLPGGDPARRTRLGTTILSMQFENRRNHSRPALNAE
jgi:hypothetical protein